MLQKQGYPQIKAIYASFFFLLQGPKHSTYLVSLSAAAFGPHRRQNHDASFYESAVFWLQLLWKTSINGWSTKPTTKLQLFLAFTTYLTFFFFPAAFQLVIFLFPWISTRVFWLRNHLLMLYFVAQNEWVMLIFFSSNNSNQRSELIIKIKFLLQYPKDESYLHD